MAPSKLNWVLSGLARTWPSLTLKRDGHHDISLGDLFYCLSIFMMEKIFLLLSQNLFCLKTASWLDVSLTKKDTKQVKRLLHIISKWSKILRRFVQSLHFVGAGCYWVTSLLQAHLFSTLNWNSPIIFKQSVCSGPLIMSVAVLVTILAAGDGLFPWLNLL